MRHGYFGRKLSRTKNERRRLFQGLTRDMFVHGRIKTTLAKAKAVQPIIEQLITKAKRGTSTDKIQIEKTVMDNNIEKKIFTDAKTRFEGRKSGFTQIIKLGARKGDGAEEVMLQFVDVIVATEVIKPKSPRLTKTMTSKIKVEEKPTKVKKPKIESKKK